MNPCPPNRIGACRNVLKLESFGLLFLLLSLLSAPLAAAEPAAADSLRVTVAQIPVTRDIAINVETIHRALDTAIAERSDILLTPEGSLSGYTHQFDQAKVERALKEIVAKASKSNLALALGTCYVESDDGKCYNQIRFYDEEGKFSWVPQQDFAVWFHDRSARRRDQPLCGSTVANV